MDDTVDAAAHLGVILDLAASATSKNIEVGSTGVQGLDHIDSGIPETARRRLLLDQVSHNPSLFQFPLG